MPDSGVSSSKPVGARLNQESLAGSGAEGNDTARFDKDALVFQDGAAAIEQHSGVDGEAILGERGEGCGGEEQEAHVSIAGAVVMEPIN